MVFYYNIKKDTLKIFRHDFKNKLNTEFKIYDFVISTKKINEIKKLFMTNNFIKSIDELPDNLILLNCSSNNIVKINNLPNTLVKLVCDKNKLLELDFLPESLKYIDCKKNNISNVDNLPVGLEYLNCSYNNIKNIDNLPNQLEILSCSHNKIKNILNLPKNIKKLDCSYNNINHIILPQNLIFISIDQKNINNILPNIENLINLINMEINENNFYYYLISCKDKKYDFENNYKCDLLNKNPKLNIKYNI